MSTVPNSRRSKVSNTTVTPAQWDCTPTITRSNVKESSFMGLSCSSTCIYRSDLKRVTVEAAAAHGGSEKETETATATATATATHKQNKIYDEGNIITRCTLHNCTLSNTHIKRCTLEGCILRDVHMHRVDAQKSQVRSVDSIKRSHIIDSVIQDNTTLWRSMVKHSIVRDSALQRSTLAKSTVSNSRIQRAKLVDCEVTECVISRTDFRGMVLKYGVWDKGELVGRIGNHEVVAVKKDVAGLEDHGIAPAAAGIPSCPPPAYHLDSDDSWQSDDLSDRSEDLPPLYKV